MVLDGIVYNGADEKDGAINASQKAFLQRRVIMPLSRTNFPRLFARSLWKSFGITELML